MSRLSRIISNPLLGVVGARVVTFPITLACGLVWLRLVIGHFGAADYAFLALIIGLQFLLGFLDFGTAAHVLESAGQYRVHKEVSTLGRALGAAWKMIFVGNSLLLMGAVALLFLGLWGPILGFPERTLTAGLAVVMILAVNALARPLSLSTALVAGLGKPAIATWTQALTGLSSLGILVILLSLDTPVAFIATTPIAGQLIAFTVLFVISLKTVPGLVKATLLGMRRSGGSDQKLRHLAVPMLLIQLIGPLSNQLDRLVLSHLSTVGALAMYSLGAQLLTSAMSFITVLTAALWAEFAELRAKGGPHAAITRSLKYIKRLWMWGVLLGVAFATLSRVFSPFISDGQLHLSWAFCAVLGATLPLSGIGLILGLGLTDPRSLRVQPVLLSLTTAINLAVTVALAAPLGALGPALASLIAALIHLPLLSLLAWWRLRREARQDDSTLAPVSIDSLAFQRTGD
jgi:O-antigen/teichoic acid export membrane protein